jgi:hypothetical protein
MFVLMTVSRTDQSTVSTELGTLPSASSRLGKPGSTSKAQIVSRLKEILSIREEAYRSRNDDILVSIYSRDCPCLVSDRSAIDELLREKRIWDGIRTSIKVREATKLNERVWTVVGLFRSETLNIRTEDGRLVRKELGGVDLFRFTLVKPEAEQEWLLGLVSVLQGP